jgi:hypothetical protein
MKIKINIPPINKWLNRYIEKAKFKGKIKKIILNGYIGEIEG